MSTPSPTILVVDDEPDICRNLVDIFEDLGYRVDMAHDGEAALRLVRKQHYDLALLDLMMPGMDGAAVYEGIKKESAETTALLLTAYPGHPRADAAKSAGVWRVLSKPVDFANLMSVINSALEQPLVLVVDDDEDFCASLWDLLHEQGYRVCVAHNLAMAADRIAVSRYDIVLLDMLLPDGNGAEVIEKLQREGNVARIVVITGYPDKLPETTGAQESTGAMAVFTKPLDFAALLKSIRTTIAV